MTDSFDLALKRAAKERPEIADSVNRQLKTRADMRQAAIIAKPALARLVDVMTHRTGQGYKLRALLYSLYNGKPASLLEALGLDWCIRQDLCLVWLGFGWESAQQSENCFYAALKDEVNRAQLWAWFIEEGGKCE